MDQRLLVFGSHYHNSIEGDFENLDRSTLHIPRNSVCNNACDRANYHIRFFLDESSRNRLIFGREKSSFSPERLFESVDRLSRKYARQEWLALNVRVPCDPWCKLKPTGESCRILSRGSAASFARCSRLNGPTYRCNDRSRPTNCLQFTVFTSPEIQREES